jgi:hypothetical protein
MSLINPQKKILISVLYAIVLFLTATCQAQYRPSVFFREDWKEIPPETPVNQSHVANPQLVLGLYGAAIDSMKKSHHDQPADDPYYVWSGPCAGNWALTLKDPGSYADLSEYAKIRWRTKQSGLRCLRILLKLADGTWLVSDQCDGHSSDWRVREFNLSDIRWYRLDIETITETQPVAGPELTRVDEIGFTDLMSGGLSNACSRVDWIEVYGKAVKRD